MHSRQTRARLVLSAAALTWAAITSASTPQASSTATTGTLRASSAAPGIGSQVARADDRQNTEASARATLDRYCLTCHNARVRSGSLALEGLDPTRPGPDAAVWERVVRKLRGGAMPPAGMPRPDAATHAALVSFLESGLDRAAEARPNPGRPSVHRLNRVEYGNAIRDLLDLEIDAAALLPPDDASYGFDNVADSLGISPALLERYLAAAEKVTALATGDTSVAPADEIYRARMDLTQTQHLDGMPLGTRGGLIVRHTFPVDADYEVRLTLWRTNVNLIRGLQFPHQVEITVDGERVHLATVGGRDEWMAHLMNPTEVGAAIEGRLRVRVPVKAGRRTVTAAFIQKTAAESPDWLQPFHSTLDPVDSNGIPRLEVLTVGGPFNATTPGDTPSRRRIFTCRPAAPAQEEGCARTILTRLARLAYRRPVTGRDIEPLLEFYRRERQTGGFERGVAMGLRRMLADPEFVFRVERDPASARAGRPYRISDLELASRLSFFLWSSIPDEPLIDLAAAGRLRNPGVLEQQVRRMLADPRAEALVTNFAGQWLFLRNLRTAIPDPLEFPDFDDNLRQAFRRETEMLVESVMREDRSVLDLLTADYTFVNERLARHYGMRQVYGSHFRRVPVPQEARRGLLGHGSILTVTSYANRTSPVLRGKWILENVLGSPPPAPPADVPALVTASQDGNVVSLRERMEAHRASPTCAGCHRLMDPIGFAMENFDGVGAWRTTEDGVAIDASTQLADGTTVNGPVELRRALLNEPDTFVATMVEKLMTYAVGRGMTHDDMPAVRKVLGAAAANGYRFSAVVLGVIESLPFQMRMPADGGDTAWGRPGLGATHTAESAMVHRRPATSEKVRIGVTPE